MNRIAWPIVSLLVACGIVVPCAGGETHVLKFVPESAAACLLFPNVEQSDHLLTEFARLTRPDFDGFDLSELETTIGFTPGTIDLTKPIVVIAERPAELQRLFRGVGMSMDDPDWPTIGFTPRDPAYFDRLIEGGGSDTEIRTISGTYGRFRVLMREGVAFVSPRRGPLEAIRRTTPESSVWSQIGEAARSDALGTHVFITLSLDRWRDRMRPTLLAVTQVIKFGMMMQQKDPTRFDETRKLANWFFDGIVSAIDQMKTLSVGFAYDGRRFELAHYHTFASDGWMSDYLRKVRRSDGLSAWEMFPDRPFLFAACVDWRVPAECGLSAVFNKKCMQDPQLCRNLSVEARNKLGEKIRKLTEACRGEAFLVTSDAGVLHPIRIYGGFTIDDARRGLKLQREVREQMGEIMGGLFPGTSDLGVGGEWRQIEGVRVYEAGLIGKGTPAFMQENIRTVYGADAVYQEAAANEHTIVYAIDGKDGGVRHLLPVVRKKVKSLAENRAITNAMTLLPEDGNVYILIDVERVALSTPVLLRQGGRLAGPMDENPAEVPRQVGPLLAWSAQVADGGLTGRFAMDRRDVGQALAAIVKVGRELGARHAQDGAHKENDERN